MVLTIEAIFPSASTPAARTIEFLRRVGREMGLLVTVEIVLALCLVFAVGVKTEEDAWFGGSGVGGASGFVAAALGGGVDGSGVGNVYEWVGVCCARIDGLGAAGIALGGGGIGVV